MTDYTQYVLSSKEKLLCLLGAGLGLWVVGYSFFNNVYFACIIACGAVFYPRYHQKMLAERRRRDLSIQFKDALYYLASALGAGKSLETAIRVTLKDLQVLVGDQETMIIRELQYLCHRLDLNEPVELCLADFARRSGMEDIMHFAHVVSICRHSGGNMVEVVKKTAAVISEKMEISLDIQLQLSKQRFEQKVLNLMPFVFIVLLKVGGGGYLEPLYASPQGYIAICLSLGILVLALEVSRRILDIRI